MSAVRTLSVTRSFTSPTGRKMDSIAIVFNAARSTGRSRAYERGTRRARSLFVKGIELSCSDSNAMIQSHLRSFLKSNAECVLCVESGSNQDTPRSITRIPSRRVVRTRGTTSNSHISNVTLGKEHGYDH